VQEARDHNILLIRSYSWSRNFGKCTFSVFHGIFFVLDLDAPKREGLYHLQNGGPYSRSPVSNSSSSTGNNQSHDMQTNCHFPDEPRLIDSVAVTVSTACLELTISQCSRTIWEQKRISMKFLAGCPAWCQPSDVKLWPWSTRTKIFALALFGKIVASLLTCEVNLRLHQRSGARYPYISNLGSK